MLVYSNTIPNKKMPTNKGNKDFVGDNHFLLNNKYVNFKGKMPKVGEAVKAFGEDFGKSASEHFEKIIKKASNLKKSGLNINIDDTITFTEQPFHERALDILLYPVKDMPIDLTNVAIKGLKKIAWFKNSAWLNDFSAKPFLKNRRDTVENKSNVASIQHYFELLAEGNEGKDYLKRFLEGHTRFKPLMPNYNAEAERSLNRIVTGLIPAFFLANDAYNLSMYMNNNKDAAKKEKERRFNQEVARIGITATATFYLMSIFSKQCNKSIPLTAGLTAGMVLVSEVMGRLMAGNPVLPVSVEKAKEYAQKRKGINQNNTIESSEQKDTTENKPTKKGFLTTSNILKVLGGLVVFGFAVDKVSNIPKVSKKLGKFDDWYKGLYTEKYTISREKFTELINKLHENGFGKMADVYEAFINTQKGEKIIIGHKQNKAKYVIIHQILTFPIRFVKDVALLPYKKIVKPLSNVVKEKFFTKEEEKVSNDLKKYKSKFEDSKKITMLQNSIKFLEKIENGNPIEFRKKVNEKLISSFDNLTKSSYENSDLNVVVKTAQSTVTTGFLIADNYNLVMIDSQGKDKDLAEQKAKERAIQRGTRLTYEAFILKMVLDMFKGVCSNSLVGALGIVGALRVITEMIERKAVGLPLGESTQEEIKQKEIEHLSATGLKGSYFRAMAKLTGKKPLSENKNK